MSGNKLATANEMEKYRDKTGRLEVKTGKYLDHSLWFEVKCVDVKSAYGKIFLEVQPVAGSGQAWVARERVLMPN